MGVVLNTVICIFYAYGLDHLHAYYEKSQGRAVFLPLAHSIFFWSSVILLPTLLPVYIVSVYLNPGYILKQYDYIKVIDKALEYQISLDNFCSYDEVMKTETSFHCHTCGRCVEQFDHHCPFINNCLGYRNHKYFTSFVFLYAAFLMVVFLETLRHFGEVCIDLSDENNPIFDL
jgi:hypothetical protein